MQFLLATSNPGKLREFGSALLDLNLELLTLAEVDPLTSPEETGRTFPDNARLKAEFYCRRTGYPALADDSGLEVAGLKGAPGIHSARYADTDQMRISKLLSELAEVERREGDVNRRARFVCAICLFAPDFVIEVTGQVEGLISQIPAGSNGFGYDPVFFYPPAGRTFAQMTPAEKGSVSHRAVALNRLREELTGRGFSGRKGLGNP